MVQHKCTVTKLPLSTKRIALHSRKAGQRNMIFILNRFKDLLLNNGYCPWSMKLLGRRQQIDLQLLISEALLID